VWPTLAHPASQITHRTSQLFPVVSRCFPLFDNRWTNVIVEHAFAIERFSQEILLEIVNADQHTVVKQFAYVNCSLVMIARALLEQILSQANEGMWRMPGHTEATKAVVSCDKLGGAAHTH